MHIAYITTGLAPFDQGGPATVAYQLLRQLLKMEEIDVSLIVCSRGTKRDITNIFGCQFKKIILMPLGQSMWFYLSKMGQIRQALNSVDLVHVNDFYMVRNFYFPLLAYVHKIPLVYSYHGWISKEIRRDIFYRERARKAKSKVLGAFFTFEKKLWSAIIVNSKYQKRIALEYEGFDESKIFLIPHGFDSDGIKKAPRISLQGEVKLLYIGSLHPRKGLDLALKAISMLDPNTRKKIKMYVVGGGHEKTYKSLATSLNIEKNIKFLGPLPLNHCYSLYKSCDIFVAPSRRESFGIAVLEALYSGIPVLATATEGIPELIKNERNGYLVSQSPVEISQKIRFLIENPEICKRISRNSAEGAKKYSWSKIAKQYLKLYKSLVT